MLGWLRAVVEHLHLLWLMTPRFEHDRMPRSRGPIKTPHGEKRYSPAVCLGSKVENVTGDPNPKHISPSYVERQNLAVRMSMRRFTRLTNAFSKKLENHAAAVALYFMYCNFGRVHQTLLATPALEAGVSLHIWSIEEIVSLLEAG
jgi:hypothetical protein